MKHHRAVFLKLDFHKEYDTVHWPFLREVLLHKGFDDRWVTRVMQLVSCGRTAVNINGDIGPYFPTLCGVRQGDPFSPFLFNMVVDSLASILDKAKDAGHIRGIVPHLVRGGGVSLLQYADDTIIMVEGSVQDIANLKFLLLCFQQMLGLTINFDKSEVMVLGFPPEEAQAIADRLNCRLGSFPTTYLGIPISDSRLTVADLRPTVTRCSCDPYQLFLASLLWFLMSFYSLHETLHQEIAKYQSRFFWAGEGDKQKYHMVSWPDICKPKDQGGLGILSSRRMNIALLTRWLWHIANGDGGLWLTIIQNKYLRGHPLAFCQRSGGSQFWQAVVQLLPVLRIGTSIAVGTGSSTLFWFDRWIGDSPLAARFPELFAIAVDPRVSVETTLIYLGRLAFHRPFGPPEVAAWDALMQDIALLPMDGVGTPDVTSWRLEPSGCFSTKSLYAAITPSTAPESFSLIWDIRLPLKIGIFLWQWIRGSLPSGVEVLKRNGPGNGMRPLCDTVEDANHIFFSCSTAQFLWSCFRETVGGQWCNTNFPDLLAEIHAYPPATATSDGSALGSLPGRSGPFAISLSFRRSLFDVLLTPSLKCVDPCSSGGRLAPPGSGRHQQPHRRPSFDGLPLGAPAPPATPEARLDALPHLAYQQQYWSHTEEGYNFVTVDQFCDKFKASQSGQNLAGELLRPYDESKGHKNALSFSIYSLSKWDLVKACFARELLLMKRNAFLYITKTIQLGLIAAVTGTVFLRTHMGVDRIHANYYMSSLFYALLLLMVNGFPELAMAINRLPVFYKQRDYYFYPAWAYAIPSFILKIPLSLVESVAWTSISYYLIGYTPEATRFFSQLLVLFLIHTVTLSQFRCVASYCQTMVVTSIGGTMIFLVMLLFGGFIIPRPLLPNWLKWGFWLSPLSYGEIGLTGNEFLAPRWLKITLSGVTLGRRILMDQGLDFSSYFYWISVGALIGFTLLFNVGFAIGLTIKNRSSRAIISRNNLATFSGRNQDKDPENGMPNLQAETALTPNRTGRMEMREHGYMKRKLQLLHNITGAFQPGILSALMGVTGAGKTTLLDVLAGRKTGGVIEGDIRIGGYPKIQQTFARISGYCEQTDVHSPQITVGESVAYSAWLRLPPEIDSKARNEFVNEVLETIELDEIRDSLVGISGVNGLSTEQRKRLTIAVELVSNPSIIFMDEPTSGLDARAAAIVMRAVKNVADTGRTVVCTIHQPSIDIFEAFDELMLMKRGGELIYAGPVGHHSCEVIKYFQAIPGVPRIKDKYNPSTWMLEVTSTSMEVQLGADFAQMYRESSMWKDKDMVVKRLSTPVPGSVVHVDSISNDRQIPRWWIWFYYVSPMSWALRVLFTTQFGDYDDMMIDVFGETKSVPAFMKDYFGFRRDLLPLAAVVLAAFPILLAVLFGYNISKLNFQRR
ncbi:ABC transporter G family member 37 [Triticum urartu]|uniref:ABC transporter G family member 37 n=1 Tax=Triticum urartu TaxID=4572 RepID=M7ZHD2_TRIUA|nr:ABC transporter G family member 37 [Triticum urartu]